MAVFQVDQELSQCLVTAKWVIAQDLSTTCGHKLDVSWAPATSCEWHHFGIREKTIITVCLCIAAC